VEVFDIIDQVYRLACTEDFRLIARPKARCRAGYAATSVARLCWRRWQVWDPAPRSYSPVMRNQYLQQRIPAHTGHDTHSGTQPKNP